VKEAVRAIKEIREALPGQLAHVFGEAIPAETIPLADGSRERTYDTRTTFWAFQGQIFRGGSLREAVREVQASRERRGLSPISENTASYCDARTRLPQELVDGVHEKLCRRLETECARSGRRVVVVDGSSAQLADTAANQLDYPQSSVQKRGCGWPVMQAVALYDLDTGALLRVADSAQTDHEAGWFQVDLIDSVKEDDIVLTDRGFCSYLNFGLILGRGADALSRLHQSRKLPFKGKRNECLVTWKRPRLSQMPPHLTEEEWEQLPETITVRYIRFRIDEKGFRTREIILATTLLDVPAKELMELYRRRWEVELCFRDIKTTLGMGWIDCKTPAMARKQLKMFMIAHNLIRWLLQRASRRTDQPLRRLSFKGALDAVLRWIPELHGIPFSRRKDAVAGLLCAIASDLLPHRPNRFEPRRQKHRPKYSFLTRPRNEYLPQGTA
jgi:hypothetical protein